MEGWISGCAPVWVLHRVWLGEKKGGKERVEVGQISAFQGRSPLAAEGKLGGLLSLSKALDIS